MESNSSSHQHDNLPEIPADIYPPEKIYETEWNKFKRYIDGQRNLANLPKDARYLTRETVDYYFQKELTHQDHVTPTTIQNVLPSLQWYADNVEYGTGINHKALNTTNTASFFVVSDSIRVQQSLKDHAERYNKREFERAQQNINEERVSEVDLSADLTQILPLLEESAGNIHGKLLLRLVADMFRQQADLYSEQALILEQVATAPHRPSSWKTQVETPERLQQQILQERTSAVAMKSYEGMLQVQKRVDYLDGLLRRSGIKKIFRESHLANLNAKLPLWQRYYKKDQPMYWFRRENFDHIMEEVKLENPSDSKTRWNTLAKKKIEALWSSMNPAQRLPYVQKAQATVTTIISTEEKSPESSRKSCEDNTTQESIKGFSKDDEIFEEEQDDIDAFSGPLLGQKSEEDDSSVMS
mmetsp:Transcript_23336/g.35351  ORF Transcript_23336/g.35351 Transcript_23336/m.35351 type:complete len:413 (-) Transcript_23336:78-1316(-)